MSATDPVEPAPEAADVRPIVRTTGSGNRQLWLFGAIILLGGLLLFQALSANREAIAPATRPLAGSGDITLTAPPPLFLPPRPIDDGQDRFVALQRLQTPGSFVASLPTAPQQQQPATRVIEQAQPTPPAYPTYPQSAPAAPAQTYDRPLLDLPTPPEEPEEERVMARRLRNPSRTVPQGAIMAAVLETALDSSRDGTARAIVSRDVHSFDGTRVLVPRGSRLYGEYAADVTPGQNRALIRWQRLTRPDGVIVPLDSPAADPLGRAGVRGKVNSRFFARFGSAILQSVLDAGVGIATARATDGVIVALPGSTQQITGLQQETQVQPVLRVRQGTSVSVFVARDLDFSDVDP